MEWQKEKIEYPTWLPRELKEYVQNKRDNIKPHPAWEGETLTSWIAHTTHFMALEKRLVTTSVMKEIWELFEKKHKTDRMIYFLEKTQSLYLDALDRHITEDQKSELDTIRDLRRKIQRQTRNLTVTIAEVDELRGLYEKKDVMLSQLIDIESEMLLRLDFSLSQVPSRVHLIGRKVNAIERTPNTGAPEYVETVLKRGLPELFEEIFGSKEKRLARVVSLVILDKPVPAEPDMLRDQVDDSIKSSKRTRKKNNIR